MQWYEKFNEEGLTYDDGLYEEHGHSLLALFLALLLYVMLLACIFLEIPYAITEQTSIIPHGNDLLDQLPRRSSPARVVSLTLPAKKAAPAPRTRPAPPAPSPRTAAPEPPVPATKPQPSAPVTAPLSSPAPSPTPGPATTASEPATLPTTDVPPPALPLLPTRRGRTSWVRKPAQPTVPTDNTPTPTYHENDGNTGQMGQPTTGHGAFSGLENISSQHVNRLPICEDGDGGEPSFGSPLGHGNGRAPSAEKIARNMEFELFATRLVHNVCDTSHQEPFCLVHNPISTHTSVVSITVARTRKITAVHFLQPSPSKALDAYIERIIYATTAPLLPASWHEETLTLPLSINMRSFPGTGELTLIPSK